MPYEFTKEHRARLSESLKGVRNAAGPHQMTPRGRANLRLAQLRRWHAFYQKKAKTSTGLKKERLLDKVAETEEKIAQTERRIKQYGWEGNEDRRADR